MSQANELIKELENNKLFDLTPRLKEFLIQHKFTCKASFYGMSKLQIEEILKWQVEQWTEDYSIYTHKSYLVSYLDLLDEREKNQFRCIAAYITSELNGMMGINEGNAAIKGVRGPLKEINQQRKSSKQSVTKQRKGDVSKQGVQGISQLP